MKTKIISILAFVSFLGIAGFVYTTQINTTEVNANPDYICIKNVSNSACEITSCGPWQEDHTRTCYWKRTTQVAYYNLRTTCEKGYGNGTKVTTANDQVHYSKADATHILWIRTWRNIWWKGWRHSADFTYATEDCQVIQKDIVAPVWENETSY